MRYLFNAWPSIEKRLSRAKHILLCTDFDGTLTPIKPRPCDVHFSSRRRQLLRKISQNHSCSLGIISGRSLRDLKQKVDVKELIYAGNHGLEINYKKQKFIYPAAKKYVAIISHIAQKLKKKILPFPGAILEAKRLSLSLHYRLVKKENFGPLKEIFFQNIKPYLAAGEIKLTHGKKVWELRPPIAWDKGKAVRWLKQRLKPKAPLAIYIGDDLTDEDAFRAVNRFGGISILVGHRKASCAKYYLKNTEDIQRFLVKIEKESSEKVQK